MVIKYHFRKRWKYQSTLPSTCRKNKRGGKSTFFKFVAPRWAFFFRLYWSKLAKKKCTSLTKILIFFYFFIEITFTILARILLIFYIYYFLYVTNLRDYLYHFRLKITLLDIMYYHTFKKLVLLYYHKFILSYNIFNNKKISKLLF